jgi:hypothetical protein
MDICLYTFVPILGNSAPFIENTVGLYGTPLHSSLPSDSKDTKFQQPQ